MGNMSLKKLTGICFIVGVLANTLPFILTIFAGATPEEGVNIFQFFSGEFYFFDICNNNKISTISSWCIFCFIFTP